MHRKILANAQFEAGNESILGALVMGKYLLGWILGVPFIVLVIIYLIFN
jgi:hypothetical protein